MEVNRGLDLSRPDEVSDAEVEQFRKSYELSHGNILDAYEFWLEHSPTVVKSHRIQAYYSASDEGRSLPLHGTLGFLYLYTVMAYDFGIEYEIRHARSLGATKGAVLQVLELAFIHCGPRGIHRARLAASGLLADWPYTNEDMSAAFPPGWSADPHFLPFSLDLTSDQLTPQEDASIRGWYIGLTGEVPGHVDFLAAGRPGLLKAYMARLGRAMSGPLPRQIFPFVELQMNVARGNTVGIRESALLGRGMGMTDDQLYEAAAWGMMYGGPAALSLAYEVLSDVLPVRRAES